MGGGSVPQEKIKDLISEVSKIIFPIVSNSKYASYTKAVQKSGNIEGTFESLESAVKEVNATKANIISLIDKFNTNKQNYLLQINAINYLHTLMNTIKGLLTQENMVVPALFNEWTGKSLSDIIILADSVTQKVVTSDNPYYTAYKTATSYLKNSPDIDVTKVKEYIDSVKVSSTSPFISEVFREGRSGLQKEFKSIREITQNLKTFLKIIRAPSGTVLKKLYSILRYYGMDRPIELLKIGDVEEFFNLNPVTITYEGKISESISDLISESKSPDLSSWLTQLYYQSFARNRGISMMGQ